VEQKKENGQPGLFAVNLVRVWAMTLYMPLRTRVGRHHFSFCPIIGWFGIFFWSGVTNSPSLIYLAMLDMLVWASEFFSQCVRRWKGIIEHTGYPGFPFATYWLFRDEKFCKLVGEPLISVGVGTLIYFYSPEPDAASYFWWGAFAMFGYQAVCDEEDQRVIDIGHNIRIENEYHNSKFKRRL
jgi:hypothetical protein